MGDRMFEVSMADLKNVFADFHNVTKFKIVLYDADRSVLYSYPETMCRFCKTVRTNPRLREKCIACDRAGLDVCQRTRKPYIYECHMSVTEAIAPIYADEILVGYLMFGQILRQGEDKTEKTAERISSEYHIDLTGDMLSEMPVADMSYINSAVNMMSMCANYLCTKEIIRKNPDKLISHLEEFINAHLDADVSVDAICRHFYISRTKLYKLSKQAFHMGISDYIRAQRIGKAKSLLVNTNQPVSQIAASVGMPDTNYFIRIFKQTEQITPLQYRKRFG